MCIRDSLLTAGEGKVNVLFRLEALTDEGIGGGENAAEGDLGVQRAAAPENACLLYTSFSNAPIILLTAKSETEDKVLGLNVGADDYITKPFVPVEVLARVRSQLRRYAQLGSRPEEGSGSITIGGIVLDDRTKTVTVEGEPVSLTPTEYAILHLLMANPGKVFSTKVPVSYTHLLRSYFIRRQSSSLMNRA